MKALREVESQIGEETDWISSQSLWLWEDLFRPNDFLESLTVKTRLGAEGAKFMCEGLRVNQKLRHLDLDGTFLRPAGAQCMRNVLSQNGTVNPTPTTRTVAHC